MKPIARTLVVAGLAIAGFGAGYAAPPTAEEFAALEKQANQARDTNPDVNAYVLRNVEVVAAKGGRRCLSPLGGRGPDTFKLVLRVGGSGKVDDVVAYPPTGTARCMAKALTGATLEKPPVAPLLLPFGMNFQATEHRSGPSITAETRARLAAYSELARNADEDLKSAGGLDYVRSTIGTWTRLQSELIGTCGPVTILGPFDITVAVAADGSVQKIGLRPENDGSVCVAQWLLAQTFPKPPKAPFHVWSHIGPQPAAPPAD